MVSFKHDELKDWPYDILLSELLMDRKRNYHESITSLILHVVHERLRNNTDYVDDYLIEIISGIRIVNALPYKLEIKCNESMNAKTNSLSKVNLKLQPGKCALLPMIKVQSKFQIRIIEKKKSFIDSDGEVEEPISSPKSKSIRSHTKLAIWSDLIDLKDVFHSGQMNITEEEIKLPCEFHPNLKVKLRKIRDSSIGESFAPRYTSTPTIEIYTDFWIQNNSGIRLSYRMKSRSSGEVEEISDNECSLNSFPPLYGTITSTNGPVLGLIGMTSFQLKCSKTQEIDEQMISLQDFEKVNIQVPNLGQQSKNKWSSKVKITSASFSSFELLFGNLYFGLSLHPGIGVFQRTKILVITPRYLIQNLTSHFINVFPVRIWKRFRVASTGAETECKLIFYYLL